MTASDAARRLADERRYLLMRPVAGWSTIVSVLVAVTIATVLAVVWSMWNGYFLVVRYLDDEAGVTVEDVYASDELSAPLNWCRIAALLVSGGALIAWLYRARFNAEVLCLAPHRRKSGWLAGSWFCPVVNLWFPFQVVSDIWKASRLDTPRELDSLSRVRGSGMLGVWWTAWIGYHVLSRVATTIVSDDLATFETYRTAAIIETAGMALLIAAGILLIMAMRQIGRWQVQPR